MSDIFIDKREFVRQFSKYLKQPGMYVLTGRDGSQMVEIYDLGDDVRQKSNIETKFEEALLKPYGCGCEREEGNPLCRTHGRL